MAQTKKEEAKQPSFKEKFKQWWASKSWTPKSVGVGLAGSVEAGTGHGGRAGSGSVVYNLFNALNSKGKTTKGVTTTVGGTGPSSDPLDSATGLSGGLGAVLQLSNAETADQATGKATSFNATISPFVSLSFGIDVKSGIYSLTIGPGIGSKGNGWSASAYTTATITGKDAVDALTGN